MSDETQPERAVEKPCGKCGRVTADGDRYDVVSTYAGFSIWVCRECTGEAG
jgi:hypothetical protein